MNNSRSFLAVTILSGVFVAGCEEEGPGERAGQALDDAMSEAQDRFEDARDELEEAAEEIGEALSGE